MKNQMNSQRGNVLAYVMMVMVVVFIIVSAVASLTQANIRQASAQEKGMQAYYVARSGAELAYEALLTTTPSLLDQFAAGSLTELTQDDIDFDEGIADVHVTTSGGTGDDLQKILIESVGTLKEKNISRTVTLEFYINYDDHPDIVWSH